MSVDDRHHRRADPVRIREVHIGARLDDEIEGAQTIGLRFTATRGAMSLPNELAVMATMSNPPAFATATTTYREMGMTYWLEKAEAELNVLR